MSQNYKLFIPFSDVNYLNPSTEYNFLCKMGTNLPVNFLSARIRTKSKQKKPPITFC